MTRCVDKMIAPASARRKGAERYYSRLHVGSKVILYNISAISALSGSGMHGIKYHSQ